MTKRTARALALVLSAAPLLIVGCGDSENKGGTGGSGGGLGGAIKYDSGGGAGGAKMDVGVPDLPAPTPDTAPVIDTTPAVDVAVTPADTTPVMDAGIPDAPIVPDAPITLDTAKIDSQVVVDTAAVDTTPAIDTTPVACTMTTPFTGGDVTANLTLTRACSPYMIDTDIVVNGNATLTIEAGVTLQFDMGVQISIGYLSAARLVAVGTATSPIIFTSSIALPSAGDWSGIVLLSGTTAGTQIAYASMDYCGSGTACLQGTGVKPNRVTIDHVTIKHVGATANGIQEDDVDSNFAISNCTFSNIQTSTSQQYAISVSAASFAGIDSTNTFNGGALIELQGGTVAASTTWKNPGTPVAVTSNLSLDGTPAPVLNIAAGTKFEFAQGKLFDIAYSSGGNLKVNGTSTALVTFTSFNTSQAAGDWAGIMVWSGGQATITYANVSYGGNDQASASISGDISVADTGATLVISNSTLSNSKSFGIYVPCTSSTASTVTNTNNTFPNNASGDVGPGPTGADCAP